MDKQLLFVWWAAIAGTVCAAPVVRCGGLSEYLLLECGVWG